MRERHEDGTDVRRTDSDSSIDRAPRRHRGAKPSYANVAATVALVVSLAGGTAFAAQSLITSPGQIDRGVITSGKLRKGTLKLGRLAPSTRAALAGAEGPAGQMGPAGEQGPIGPQGPPGEPGESGATEVTIRQQNFQIGADASGTGQVQCQAGERAVGGGLGLTSGLPVEFNVWSSRPVDAGGETTAGDTPTGWIGSANHVDLDDNNVAQGARVWVVCASS